MYSDTGKVHALIIRLGQRQKSITELVVAMMSIPLSGG
jgi:hypothetical protein